MLNNCSESRCLITGIRHHEQADAIIFPWVNLRTYSNLPPRQSNQLWIFFILESPDTDALIRGDRGKFKQFDNTFNWTMTHRSDSEIFVPYGHIHLGDHLPDPKPIQTLQDKIERKTKMAAAFISNCYKVPGGRTEFIQELQKYISVDIYGACGKLRCDRADFEGCWRMVARKYKFYLSFENSICRDYVTEKLFNALQYDIVPVVYGGGNYEKVAPKHSYIDAMEFKSVSELAKYLKLLDSDGEKYRKFFDWKLGRDTKATTMTPDMFCTLCQRLHQKEKRKFNSYSNLKNWWNKYPCFTSGSNILSRKFLNEQYGYKI